MISIGGSRQGSTRAAIRISSRDLWHEGLGVFAKMSGFWAKSFGFTLSVFGIAIGALGFRRFGFV